jgi:hypothetical protein
LVIDDDIAWVIASDKPTGWHELPTGCGAVVSLIGLPGAIIRDAMPAWMICRASAFVSRPGAAGLVAESRLRPRHLRIRLTADLQQIELSERSPSV